MKERLRTLLRWLDRHFIGDGRTFPIYRSSDGDITIVDDPNQGELIFAPFLKSGPAAAVFKNERFQVTVLRGTSSDGSPCFYLDTRFLDPATDSWVPLMVIHASKLRVMRLVLRDVSGFLRTNDPADCGCH